MRPDQTSQGSIEVFENTDENEDKEQDGEDSNDSSLSTTRRKSSESKKNRKEKREMKEQELKEFIKLQQRDYTLQALCDNGMIRQSNTDHEHERMAPEKTNAFLDDAKHPGRRVSLCTIDIVDSESDDMACSIIDAAPVIISE